MIAIVPLKSFGAFSRIARSREESSAGTSKSRADGCTNAVIELAGASTDGARIRWYGFVSSELEKLRLPMWATNDVGVPVSLTRRTAPLNSFGVTGGSESAMLTSTTGVEPVSTASVHLPG